MTNVQCNHLMATIWHLKNKIQFFKLKKCAESKAQSTHCVVQRNSGKYKF